MKRRKLTVWMLLVTMCGAFVLGGCSGRTGNEEEETAPAVEQEEDAEPAVGAGDEQSPGQEESEAQETAPQVTFAREEKDWYDEESGKWALHLEYDTAEVQGEGFETVAESVSQWSDQRKEELLTYGEGLYPTASEEAALSESASADSYYYSIFEELEVMRADSRVISLRELNSDYTGGAHGNYGYTGIVFDSQTGALLSLNDILKDEEGFQQEAAGYIAEELKVRYGEGLFPEYESTVEDMWESGPVWYLDGAGITFVFNPYEVGPYAMGAAEVTLPYDVFGEYMEDAYAGINGAGAAALPENTDVFLTLASEDSVQQRLNIRTETDEEYGETQITLELGDSSVVAGTFGRMGSAYLLNLTDGRSFVLFDADYASDDYVTFLYEITGGVIKEGNRLEGISLSDGAINTELLTLRMSLNVFGTYYGMMDYKIDENGMLAQQSDIFRIMGNDSDAYLLTVIQDLPVTIDGRETILPAGSRIRITGTDNQGLAYFRVDESGEEGSILYERGDGADDTWTLYVNGRPETDYFEMLPYAG